MHMYLGKRVKTLPILIDYFNSNPICPETAPKIKYENFFPFWINYVCITCFSIRSQCDLENIFNDLKVCGKKYFFLLSHWKLANTFASNNLEMNFILFTIYHSKCKNQAKCFTLILLLSGDISLNPGPPDNSQIDRLSWNVFDKKELHFFTYECK